MSLKMPDFLADLYRDLRDRRLLIPAAALLVALVAVPVVLSASAAPPPPVAQTEGIEATAATPAVLADQPGVRDYGERLKALKEKNPFDQKFAAPEPGSADISEPSTGVDASGAGGDGGGAGAGLSGDSSAAATRMPDQSSSGPGDGGGTQPTGTGKPRVKRFWWTWMADLTLGPVGELKRYDGVDALDLLPNRKNPVVVFLGAGSKGNRATFLLGNEVTVGDGDGSCSPNRARCDFLHLKPGDKRRLVVGPEDGPTVIYVLRLRALNQEIVKRGG